MGPSSKSLSSLRSSTLVDPGTGSTDSLISHKSDTLVGTEYELKNEDTSYEIRSFTQRLIAILQEYYDNFILGPYPVSQLPPPITTRLKSLTMVIDHLGKLANGEVNTLLVKDIVENVQGLTTSTLPTYATLKSLAIEMNWNVEDLADEEDTPAQALGEAEIHRNQILNTWSLAIKNGLMVSPSTFAKRRVWTRMQKEKTALLCHRPAFNRPQLPLEVMHEAFYQFVKEYKPGDEGLAKLAGFRAAVLALCEHLTDPIENEVHRSSLILQELKKVFPENASFRWRMEKNVEKGRIDLVYQRILSSKYHPRFPQEPKVDYVTNLIIIEVKLEEGNGDAFMQVSRYYGNIVESNPRYYETGAPMFLITISGTLCF